MTDITKYETILRDYNWTGLGSGSTVALPSTALNPDGSGFYTIRYNFLVNTADLDATGYYDTLNNDTDSNPSTIDDEYTYFRALNSSQENAAKIIMHEHVSYNYTYSSFFGDVAKINFSSDTSSNAEIVFGQNDKVSPIYDDPAISEEYIGGLSHNYQPDSGQLLYQPIEKKYGDVWLNKLATNSANASPRA